MNERIIELVSQADDNFQLALVPAEIVENFAKLIIRDCIEIVEPCKCGCYACEAEGIIANATIAEIKEHFGIK